MPKVSYLEVHAGGVIERKKELWQPSCQNCRGEGKKINGNCGSQVAEIREKRREKN